MTYLLEPASFYDYQMFNITFLPNQQSVSWEFELNPDKSPKENETFHVILSSVSGFPNFLSDSDDVVNEIFIVIHEPQS